MVGAAREYAKANPNSGIERVVFVLFGEEDYDMFRKTIAQE